MLRRDMGKVGTGLCLLLLSACTEPLYAEDMGTDLGPIDAGDIGPIDHGPDATHPLDGGSDAGHDAGEDADIDAGFDAGAEDAGHDAGCSTTCYADNDNDGFAAVGASTSTECACGTNLTETAPTTNPTIDCNDGQQAIGPATMTDTMRCGSCSNVCTATNGTPSCAGGSCSMNCNNGFALVGGACVVINPPRQVAPMSTATTTSRRPSFRWELAPNTNGGRLQVCAQRACSTVLAEVDVTGSTAQPAANLAAGLYYWRVFGRNGTRVGLTPSVVWQVRVPPRSAPTVNSSSGQSADFNGDGFGDIAVGSPQASSAGRVHIYYGSSTGPATSPDRSLTSPGGNGGQFGVFVGSMGDVNGDGYPDLAVSANAAAGGAGRAYLYYGSASGISATASHTLYPPTSGSKYFSIGISGGDIDGDGYADIVVGGTPTASSNGGWLHVFYGSEDGPPEQPSLTVSGPLNVYFAYFVDVGDFEGDGFADVLVSAWPSNGTGQAFVYRGSSAGLIATASPALNSPSTGMFGQGGLAAVGDLNGDGRGDAAIGDYNSTATGQMFVYYGGGAGLPAAPSVTIGTPGGCCMGSSLRAGARNADVNGDGYMDLVMGNELYPASGADRQGRAYVFLGGPAGISAAPETNIPNPDGTDANFGVNVVAGDIDGDGFSDLIVGSYLANRSGRVHIFRGSGTGVLTAGGWSVNGPDGASSTFGGALADARDRWGSLRRLPVRYQRPIVRFL